MVRHFALGLLVALLPAPATGAERAERVDTGWSLYFDNDFFALGDRDNDYTGGIAYKRSGRGVKSAMLSLDGWLGAVDDWVGLGNLYRRDEFQQTHSREFGITLFTPEDLEADAPIADAHPYASLFFSNNTRLVIDPANQVTYRSTLTVGLIGLPLAEDVQVSLHELFGATEPEGWANQISDGGEPTFRYTISRSRNLLRGPGPRKLEIKSSIEANVGFTTDVGVALSLRSGRIRSPWWAFNLHNAEYISLGSPTGPGEGVGPESYFWFGASLKLRAYNALLEGQFRDSAVTFDRDELEALLVESWLGYTHEFDRGWSLSGFIRGRTQEIDVDDLKDPVWGGFIFGRDF